MKTINAYSDQVLENTIARVLVFLRASKRVKGIRTVLAQRGYTTAIRNHGWKLFFAATGFEPAQVSDTQEDPKDTAALEFIDAWDEPNFRVAHAALDNQYPVQSAYLFQDLEPQTGMRSIVSVTTFLNRCDTLESGEGRKDTHKQDMAAMKKLSERGITPAVRKNLREKLAEATVEDDVSSDDSSEPSPDTAQARAAKVALRVWYEEWAGIAKADIKRRDYLIRLGLGERKVAKVPAPAPQPQAAPALSTTSPVSPTSVKLASGAK